MGMILAVISCLMITSGAWAAAKGEGDQAGKEMQQQAEESFDDPLGRSTPQGTVVGFLRAMEREDYERAIEYLDTRQKGKNARQLALELQRVLDERVSVSRSRLSTKPEGELDDGLPAQEEVVASVKTKTGGHKILLERLQKEDSPKVWLFSSETLRSVPRIYEEIEAPWFEGHLPAALTGNRLAGPLYRWILPLLMLPAAIFCGWILTVLCYALLQKSIRHRVDELGLITLGRIRKPLVVLFSAGVIYLFSLGSFWLLDRLFWTFLSSTMALAGLTWICIQLVDVGAEILERRRPDAASAVIRLSATLFKALAVITALVVSFHYFAGINLTAVVAGLGIGGIAVAFAAQKTIENFLGGVFLVWDKPIRLGDFCKAGELQGTVEHIGLRSTQIRTLNRTVAFIPNGQLASISVELCPARPLPFPAYPEPALRDDGGSTPLPPGAAPRASLPASPGGFLDSARTLHRLRSIVPRCRDLCLRHRNGAGAVPLRPGGPAAADHGARRVGWQRLCFPIPDTLYV